MPMRVTDDLVNMLKKYHPIYVNTHLIHYAEIQHEAKEAGETRDKLERQLSDAKDSKKLNDIKKYATSNYKIDPISDDEVKDLKKAQTKFDEYKENSKKIEDDYKKQSQKTKELWGELESAEKEHGSESKEHVAARDVWNKASDKQTNIQNAFYLL